LTAVDIKNTLKLVENAGEGDHKPCSTGTITAPVSHTIRIYQAFYPIIVLGPDQNAAYVEL
jgi:hypothetical protein